MSAPRPRPVTAKVRRPPPTGTYRAKKNITLLSDSSGSTESLISCVDDEDLSSFNHLHSETSDLQTAKEREYRPDNGNNNNNSSDSASFSERIISEKSALTSVTQTDEGKGTSTPEVGPWEQWMIKKSESMKKLSQQKIALERLRKEQEKQQELEKKEREVKAERIRKEWLEQKNAEKLKAERRQMLREKRKRQEEEMKKQEIEEKAERKYQEWLEQKKKTDELQHALDIERQKLRELELKDKKEKSDAAFKSWLGKSLHRAKTLPHSYAKCDGTITGYYNSGASPSPSFYNPIPWQPVALPQAQSKTCRVKGKGKRKVRRNAWMLDN